MSEFSLYKQMSAAGHFLHHYRGAKPTQEKTLHIIHRRRGSITQRELQDILQIQQGSISEMVSKMEDNGLIIRTQDPKDRRRMILQLTREGERIREENIRKNLPEEEALFDVLTDEEKEQLSVLMSKLLDRWLQHR